MHAKKMKKETIPEKIARGRIYLLRSLAYVGIFNTIMLIVLSLDKFSINLKHWLIPISLLLVVILVLVGFIEDKLGVFEAENNIFFERNKVLRELIDDKRKRD